MRKSGAKQAKKLGHTLGKQTRYQQKTEYRLRKNVIG
jgi:hypothetical protein